jgi:hypothetical protein
VAALVHGDRLHRSVDHERSDVSVPDRLAEIKARMREHADTEERRMRYFRVHGAMDLRWLVDEVERLRQGDNFSRMHAEMVGLHKGFEVKEAEVARLREELTVLRLGWQAKAFRLITDGKRLRGLLRTHGIDPDEPANDKAPPAP